MRLWIKATLNYSLYVIVGVVITYLISVSYTFPYFGSTTNPLLFMSSLLPIPSVCLIFHGFHELSHIVYGLLHGRKMVRFNQQEIEWIDASLGDYLSPSVSFPISIIVTWVLGYHDLLIIFFVFLAFIFSWNKDLKNCIIKKREQTRLR